MDLSKAHEYTHDDQTLDDGGWTPLLSASSAGNDEVVVKLIAARADVNYVEEQVGHYAIVPLTT
jgi:ankyrin repeat protein